MFETGSLASRAVDRQAAWAKVGALVIGIQYELRNVFVGPGAVQRLSKT